jgi:NADPH2:quinone reductase
MRAIRVHEFGGPGAMHLEEVPDPRPAPGQVVVRVAAAGVNPVETYVRSGAYARKPALPYTPGSDGGGIVEAVGDRVNAVAPGDRVYLAGSLSGTYAELALCTESQVHPLPERVTYAQGAAIGVPYVTAYRALFQRADAAPGEVALVSGASGGVGLAAIQLGRAAGMVMVGTAGSEEGRRLVAEQGAALVVDHNDPDYLDQVAAFTGGRGPDVILEMLANVNLGHDLRALAQGGRVVVVGSRGTVEIDPRDLMARDAAVLGMLGATISPIESVRIHAALAAGLAEGVLRPIVAQELPLEAAPHAHEEIMRGPHRGKIVLVP